MPFIRDYQYEVGSANSFTAPTFNYVAGDLLLFVHHAYGSGTITWSTPTGYTALQTHAAVTQGGMYYKVATASETPQTTSHGGAAAEGIVYMLVLGNVSATPINTSGKSRPAYGSTITGPAMTTTVNRTNVYHFACYNVAGQPADVAKPTGLKNFRRAMTGTFLSVWAGETYQETAGACAQPVSEVPFSTFSIMFSVAVEAADNTLVVPYIPFATPPTTVIHPMNGSGTYSSYGGGFRDISVATELNGTLNSINFTPTSGSSQYYEGVSRIDRGIYNRIVNSTNPTTFYGFAHDFTAVDLTGLTIVADWRMEYRSSYGFKAIADAGILLGLRSGAGNYRFWVVGGYDSRPTPTDYQAAVIDVDSTAFQYLEVGTFDSSAVDSMAMVMHKRFPFNINCVSYWNNLHKVNANIMTGGYAAKPLRFRSYFEALESGLTLMITEGDEGVGKLITSYQELQIGNGSSYLFFRDPGANLNFGAPKDVGETSAQLSRPAGSLGLTIYGISGNTIDLSDIAMGSQADWYFTIHPSSTNAATWLTDGLRIVNATVLLRPVFTAASGITFSGCAEINHNGADLSGGCTIDASRSERSWELQGVNEAEVQSKVDKFANCTFTNNNIAILINYTGTGDIAITFDAVTCTGNTTDLRYFSNNPSALVATVIGGGLITSTTIGNDATGVTILNLPFTLSVSGLLAGSRVTLWNDNNADPQDIGVILQETASSGTTFTYLHDGTAIKAYLQVIKSGYLEQNILIDLASTNQSIQYVLQAEEFI